MKNTKKIISLVLAVCLIASLAISASAMELPSGAEVTCSKMNVTIRCIL